MTEAELQQAVIECANVLGWQVAHFRPAQTSKGWRTPVSAQGKGFPDLVMVNEDGRTIFAELKSERGRLSPEQHRWIGLLGVRGEAYVWKPADWVDGTIEQVLRG